MFTISYFALFLHFERSSDRELNLQAFDIFYDNVVLCCISLFRLLRSSFFFYFPCFVLCSCLSVSIFDKTVLCHFHLCFWSHVFMKRVPWEFKEVQGRVWCPGQRSTGQPLKFILFVEMGIKILRPPSEEPTYIKFFLLITLVGLVVLCVNVKLSLIELVYFIKDKQFY